MLSLWKGRRHVRWLISLLLIAAAFLVGESYGPRRPVFVNDFWPPREAIRGWSCISPDGREVGYVSNMGGIFGSVGEDMLVPDPLAAGSTATFSPSDRFHWRYTELFQHYRHGVHSWRAPRPCVHPGAGDPRHVERDFRRFGILNFQTLEVESEFFAPLGRRASVTWIQIELSRRPGRTDIVAPSLGVAPRPSLSGQYAAANLRKSIEWRSPVEKRTWTPWAPAARVLCSFTPPSSRPSGQAAPRFLESQARASPVGRHQSMGGFKLPRRDAVAAAQSPERAERHILRREAVRWVLVAYDCSKRKSSQARRRRSPGASTESARHRIKVCGRLRLVTGQH